MIKRFLGCLALAAVLTACDASSNSKSDQQQVSSTPTDSCGLALEAYKQGDDHYHAEQYAEGYKDANNALHLVGACDNNSNMRTALRGLALGVRAENEHHLPQGNSMDDMNSALTMLDTCVNSDDVLPEIAHLCHLVTIQDAAIKALWPYRNS